MENNIPVIAFSLMEDGAMIKAINGGKVGTYIGN
jgi:uridylate kinase